MYCISIVKRYFLHNIKMFVADKLAKNFSL